MKRAGAKLGLAVAASAALLLLPSHAGAARGLELGLTDGLFFSPDADTRATWFDRAVDARSDSVMLDAGWSSIAPANPRAGFDAADPNDPGYDWGTLDAAVQGATSRGLQVTIRVMWAPAWAEGANRPSDADPGTWLPQPRELRLFGEAIARRYAGRVRRFDLWAEPNLPIYLTPQWRGGRPFAPVHYRKMLNAFYAGIKSVSRRNRVLAVGAAPYGDPVSAGERMPPALFWRSLLCLRGAKLKTSRCPNPARFDIAAHNPINVDGPTRRALNRDDISTPDIGKLRRILRRAQRTGRALPRGRKPIWATEIWWISIPSPPRERAYEVPLRGHARWLAQSLYVLWRQGVRSVTWYQIRDPAPDHFFQTGLFFSNGSPKPAYRAFRFPFVGERVNRNRVRLWGIAPARGAVRVQRKRNGGWRTIKRLRAGNNRVFTDQIRLRGEALLRARWRGQTSLAWRLR